MTPERKTFFLAGIKKVGRGFARLREGRRGSRPKLSEAGGSLLIAIDPGRCRVLPDFFRTEGELRWDRARKSLVWTTGAGEERTIALPSAPDLSAIGTGGPRKSRVRAWAIGLACLLILPALWVRLLSPPPPGRPVSPSRFAPGAVPAPEPIQRISGREWMK